MDGIPPDVAAAVGAAAAQGAASAIKDLAGRVVSTLSVGLSKQLRDVASNLTANFGPHLTTTYDKCTKVKTLINPDEPSDLLSKYVRLNFRCGSKTYDDYAVIDEIRSRKRVIISGTGGGGKTIFTKYVWISIFEKPDGRIPIFIELRRMNDLGVVDLKGLIYHTIVSSHAAVPRDIFDKGIASGLFVFILDGFDEVSLEKKQAVEKEILDLSANNPECIIVVSGRPDDKFGSWQAFSIFRVEPLNKRQVEQLISKLDFNKAIKKKFLGRLKRDLYAKHQSFLSSPLLATLMLLTYSQYADIPEKIHLFYEQAFDTLFLRHDAMKEAFKRDMHSGLTIDVFKRYFSYFCLVSYFDNKIEFTESELRKHISNGLKIDDVKLNVDAFVRDLTESVCVIQRDGLSFIFTHRTFQEFFVAYALARLPTKHFRSLLKQIASRTSDNVLQMLRDLDETLIEAEYLHPEIQEFFQKFDADSSLDFLHRYLRTSEISVRRLGERAFILHSDENPILEILRNLYRADYASDSKKLERYKERDNEVIKDAANRWTNKFGHERWIASIKVAHDGVCSVTVNAPDAIPISELAPWFKDTGFKTFAVADIEIARKLSKKLGKKADKKDLAIDRLFN